MRQLETIPWALVQRAMSCSSARLSDFFFGGMHAYLQDFAIVSEKRCRVTASVNKRSAMHPETILTLQQQLSRALPCHVDRAFARWGEKPGIGRWGGKVGLGHLPHAMPLINGSLISCALPICFPVSDWFTHCMNLCDVTLPAQHHFLGAMVRDACAFNLAGESIGKSILRMIQEVILATFCNTAGAGLMQPLEAVCLSCAGSRAETIPPHNAAPLQVQPSRCCLICRGPHRSGANLMKWPSTRYAQFIAPVNQPELCVADEPSGQSIGPSTFAWQHP